MNDGYKLVYTIEFNIKPSNGTIHHYDRVLSYITLVHCYI